MRKPVSVFRSESSRDIVASKELWSSSYGNVAGAWFRSRGVFEVQNRGHKIAEGHSDVAADAFLERRIVLRAAKNVRHQLAEHGTALEELHHASSDRGPEECTAIKAANDARGKRQLRSEGSADPVGVNLRLTFREGFAEQFSRTHGIKKAFAGQRIDPSGRIADKRPILSNDSALR